MTPDSTAGTQGNRRIDRVLAEDFLNGLPAQSIEDIRSLRRDAEQEEADVSYVRRMLQGRIDIISAELERRRGGSGASLVDALPRILADDRGEPHGLGQYKNVEPSRVDQHRRRVEALVADVDISNVTAHSDDQLNTALAKLQAEETDTSETRRRIQIVVDACAAEITRRYREGEAVVEDLLPSESS